MSNLNRSAFVALLMTVLLAASAACKAQPQVRLLPAPRETHFGKAADLPARIVVSVPGRNADDVFAAHDLEEVIKLIAPAGKEAHAAAVQGIYRVVLLRAGTAEAKAVLARAHQAFDPAMEAEGYVLVIEPRAAYIVGASAPGVFYGAQTLKQLLPLPGAPRQLLTGTVRDWPAMKYRGIDDDLSRGPFPTLEFEKHQIRVFASFKINVYSPYLEHTLQYPNESLAAPPGSSLSPAEVAELVAYARQYHITVLPDQEAFGHLHNVLKYELYQDDAETPHGHVLAPGQPGTLPLIKDWFSQIAQEFPSPMLMIGADETFDLGIGRTHGRVEKQGYGPVYIDFLKQIHDELAPLHRRLLFWGDIGDANPDAIPQLSKDMIAVPWTYSRTSGFDKLIEPFSKNGIETWVAPGDSNWNEVYPVAKVAFANIQGFIRDGQRLGSTGALTTVWNDDGEGLFNMDWYTVLFGAVAAWQPGESSIANYQDAYGQVFHQDGSGKINAAEQELMEAQNTLRSAKTGLSSDVLFWLDPWSAQGQEASARILPVAHELRMHAERAILLLDQARRANPHLLEPDALTAMDLGARRLDFLGLKFQLADEIASSYAQAVALQHETDRKKHSLAGDDLSEISGVNGRCQDLRDGFSALKDEYSQVWLGENRPYWLNNVTVRYDLAIQQWQQRSDLIQAVTRDFRHHKDLPSAESLGMPAASTPAPQQP